MNIKFTSFILIAVLFCSCQDSTTGVKQDNSNNKNIDTKSSNPTDNTNNSDSIDTTGFLSNCQNWRSGTSMGYLQGVESSKDSLGSFCFYECFDCAETFEIIFIHKSNRGADVDNSIWNEFENSCHNNFMNFNCFAFVYPMRDPDQQKNLHAMNVDFPVTVKAYKRQSGDNWKFIKEIKAKAFKELSLFQFNIIYDLN